MNSTVCSDTPLDHRLRDSRPAGPWAAPKPWDRLPGTPASMAQPGSIFHIFSALAQFERRLIQERTKAGLAAARARGRKGGRPRLAQTEPRIQLARKLHGDGGVTIDDICKTLHISRTTYYRYVREGRRIAGGRLPPVVPSPDAADTASFADPPPVVDTRPPAG